MERNRSTVIPIPEAQLNGSRKRPGGDDDDPHGLLRHVPVHGELPPLTEDVRRAEDRTPVRYSEWFALVVRCFHDFKTTDAAFRAELVGLAERLRSLEEDSRSLDGVRRFADFGRQSYGAIKFIAVISGAILVVWQTLEAFGVIGAG